MGNSPYYESFDADWAGDLMFRELLLTDSEPVLDSVRYFRPFHLAACAVDPTIDVASSAVLSKILTRLLPRNSGRDYARLFLGTVTVPHRFDLMVAYIASNFIDLLRERRVFLARFPDSPPSFQRTYGALGAAQPFVLLPDGNWDASALLFDEPS